MIIRILIFSAILLAVLWQVWLLAAGLTVVYLSYYAGVELFVLAVLVDGYYGSFTSVPFVSIVTAAAIVSAWWLKPWLVLYTHSHATTP